MNIPPEMQTEAKQLWEFLDELSESDPEAYQAFISKQLKDNAPSKGDSNSNSDSNKDHKGNSNGPVFEPGSASDPFSAFLNFTVITPEPCFVAKTVDGIGKKFFLNVCSHESIDKPRPMVGSERRGGVISSDQDNNKKKNKEISLDDNDEQMRYPLSMGEIRDTKDKSGKAARVIDVVFNPQAIEVARKSRQSRDMIVEIAFANFERKFERESICRGSHVKFPNLRYKGESVPTQRIRKKGVPADAKPGFQKDISKKPEIVATEAAAQAQAGMPVEPVIEPASSKKTATKSTSSSSQDGTEKPKFAMELRFNRHNDKRKNRKKNNKKKKNDDNAPRAMLFTIELPGIKSVQECNIKFATDSFRVAAGNFKLETELPFSGESSKSQAFFVRDKSQLVAYVPIATALAS